MKALSEHQVEDAIDDIIDAGLSDYGSQSEQAITLAAAIDHSATSQILLQRLQNSEESMERGRLISMAEKLLV